MRIHALLFGGLMAGALLPSTNANAFFWLFDQANRQPQAVQPSAPYGQTYASTGQVYRYDPGYGRSYSTPSYSAPIYGDVRDGQPVAYGGQSYSTPSYGAPAYTPIPRQVVDYPTSQPPGSVIVNTSERRLYYVLGGGKAVRYGIGVGRMGFQWSGVHHVSAKKEWPDWRPPSAMLHRQPYLPRWMPGGPNNPLGARAMYIGSTEYRIHGSSEPWTIGQAVSSGCIRMTNEDVIDLYERVKIGAKVVVMR